MNDLARLEIALRIEELARKLEESMDEQRHILGGLLKDVQEYVDKAYPGCEL